MGEKNQKTQNAHEDFDCAESHAPSQYDIHPRDALLDVAESIARYEREINTPWKPSAPLIMSEYDVALGVHYNLVKLNGLAGPERQRIEEHLAKIKAEAAAQKKK